MRRALEQLFDDAANERNAGRAANEDDLVDVLRAETGVRERLAARFERAIDELTNHPVEIRACDPLVITRWNGHGGFDSDLRLLHVGEIPLRLDDGLANLLNSGGVALRIQGDL